MNDIAATPTPTASTSPTAPSSPSSDSGSSSSTPSAAAPAKISGETSDDPDFSFEGLGKDFDVLETPEPSVTATPKAPTVQPPAAAAAVPQAVPAQPVTPPPQAEPQASQPQAAAAPQSSTGSPETLDELLTMLETRGAEIADLMTQEFAVSDELRGELETDYAAAVPKLLSNVFMRSVATSLNYVKQMVPKMIQQAAVENQMYQAAEQEFFSKFPALDRAKHGSDISLYAKAFHSTNPRMSRADLFDLVGNAVMTKHKIAASQAPQQQRVPAAFSPAANSAPIVSSTPVEENPFMGLGQEFD